MVDNTIDPSLFENTTGFQYNPEPAANVDPNFLQAVETEQANQEKYESAAGIAKTAALGALKGADFTGLGSQLLTSDKVGKALGQDGPIITPEEAKEYALRNPIANVTGEAAGMAAAVLTTKGKAVSGLKVAEALGQLSEKQFAKLLLNSGGKDAASVIAKNLPKYVGSIVEGSGIGLGQLVQENALGDANLNAQNVLAAASLGGVLGGATKGVFSLIEHAAPYVNEAGKVVVDKMGNFANKSKQSAEFLNIPLEAQIKLQRTRPDIWNNLSTALSDSAEKGVFSSDKSILENLMSGKQSAVKRIDSIIDSVDSILDQNPALRPSQADIFTGMQDALKKFKAEHKTDFGMSAIDQFSDSINQVAFSKAEKLGSPMSAKEIQAWKRDIDSQIKYESKNPPQLSLALGDVRTYLSDQLKLLADNASKTVTDPAQADLLAQFKQANLDYGTYAKVLDYMTKKTENSKSLMSMLTDWKTIAALGGSLVHPGLGTALGVGRLAQTDLWRRVILFSGIERAGNEVGKAIESASNNFFKSPTIISAPSSLNAIANSVLAKPLKDSGEVKDKTSSFNQVAKSVDYLTDAENFIKTAESRLALMQKYAPTTGAATSLTLNNAINFIKSKLPQDPKINTAFSKSQWTPSSVEKARFERYLNAVENPMSVIKDLGNGHVSSEAVEALQAVYPKLFSNVQQAFLTKSEAKKDSLTYNQRVRLGTLLQIPTDTSLNQGSMLGLQNQFAPANNVPVGTVPAANKKGGMGDKFKHFGNNIETPFQKSTGR